MAENTTLDEVGTSGLRRGEVPEVTAQDLLDRLAAVLFAVEGVDDARRGMGSLTEVQVLVECYREYAEAAAVVGQRLGVYRLCLRRESDGMVVDGGDYLIAGATDP